MDTVSVKDVARLAEVSVGTVSNVLNHPGKVSETTSARVRWAIRTLGFVRNDAARQLRAGSSRAIGLLILDARNPFFTDVARGAEELAAADGYSVLLGNSSENSAREASYLDLFEEQRIRGLLISPFGDIDQRLRRLRERGIPTVLVDRIPHDSSLSSVSVDDIAGGRLAAEHLLSVGRRRIAYVGGPASIRQVGDRLEGARRAVHRTTAATLEALDVAGLTVNEGVRIGEAIIDRPRTEWPDAIFAANDLLAIGILQSIAGSGRARVPDDIALIGYDDIDFARASVVPLSSIRQPSDLIGRTALEILLDELDSPESSPRTVTYQPELVVRASTAGRA